MAVSRTSLISARWYFIHDRDEEIIKLIGLGVGGESKGGFTIEGEVGSKQAGWAKWIRKIGSGKDNM